MTLSIPDAEARPQHGRAGTISSRFCVFVSSSDRGRDIFEIVFRNAETIWRDCDWPRYVGFTSKHSDIYGFTAVAAKAPSNWQGELGDQLDSLPDHIEYVLRMDEDALFLAPVQRDKLNAVADLMVRENLSYVSLVPVSRNWAGRIVEYFRCKLDQRPFRPLSFSEPYYSSLALAIWKRSHLRDLLRRPGSIWELEHIVTDERHYAVWECVLDQRQIVTKGKWNLRAEELLARQGLSLDNSKRERQARGTRRRDIRQRIVFQLFGFLSFRLRKRFNLVPRWPVD
jgi:hypothetical protein